MELEAFQVLLARVRAGDAEAVALLVRTYEPALRRQVRMQLTDPRLRRLVDTIDVCQSVLGNFFIRMLAGEFDLDSPKQLVGLLATMARNRILNHAREQQAARRDVRRLQANGSRELLEVVDPAASPSKAVSDAELLQQALEGLSPNERALIEQRANGRSWIEISQHEGEAPETLRKRLARAIERVTRLLGLEDFHDV
jgi:RNA polymerase sigma-70 factor (ECF subfamily)